MFETTNQSVSGRFKQLDTVSAAEKSLLAAPIRRDETLRWKKHIHVSSIFTRVVYSHIWI